MPSPLNCIFIESLPGLSRKPAESQLPSVLHFCELSVSKMAATDVIGECNLSKATCSPHAIRCL